MEIIEKQPSSGRQNGNGFRDFMRSHTARFIIVGIISLMLLIPLGQMNYLIQERKSRQDVVTDELKSEWGGPIAYYGMVLKVPVTETHTTNVTDRKETHSETETAHYTGFIYPLSASDEIRSEVVEKYRGIFSTPVFTASISSKAKFDLGSLMKEHPGRKIDWQKAQIAFITNKEARFKEISGVKLNGRSLPIEYQEENDSDLLINSTAPLNLEKCGIVDVRLNTFLNGSQAIHYESLASKSTMTMSSNWKDPAFAGSSLPNGNASEIGKKGFKSTWNNLEIGNGQSALHPDRISRFSRKFSDVRFIKLVDHYQLNERTIKYGLLVLVLTFAVFFLIQIVGKVAIHPLHYFMIGLALLLFYSLLLSFSEQIGFIPAYLIASATIVLLIVWYARSILKSLKFAVMSGMSLVLLYAFLLVIVNLEVYALIVGSIGLLFVLAAIMSVTRKIDFEA